MKLTIKEYVIMLIACYGAFLNIATLQGVRYATSAPIDRMEPEIKTLAIQQAEKIESTIAASAPEIVTEEVSEIVTAKPKKTVTFAEGTKLDDTANPALTKTQKAAKARAEEVGKAIERALMLAQEDAVRNGYAAEYVDLDAFIQAVYDASKVEGQAGYLGKYPPTRESIENTIRTSRMYTPLDNQVPGDVTVDECVDYYLAKFKAAGLSVQK